MDELLTLYLLSHQGSSSGSSEDLEEIKNEIKKLSDKIDDFIENAGLPEKAQEELLNDKF